VEALYRSTSGDEGDAGETLRMLWRWAMPCSQVCCLWSLTNG